MKCPKCAIELRIASTRTQVEGDKSPDTPTRVYTVQDLTCVNPQCENYGMPVQQTRHLLYEDEPPVAGMGFTSPKNNTQA